VSKDYVLGAIKSAVTPILHAAGCEGLAIQTAFLGRFSGMAAGFPVDGRGGDCSPAVAKDALQEISLSSSEHNLERAATGMIEELELRNGRPLDPRHVGCVCR
jgi:hypothetical protein